MGFVISIARTSKLLENYFFIKTCFVMKGIKAWERIGECNEGEGCGN